MISVVWVLLVPLAVALKPSLSPQTLSRVLLIDCHDSYAQNVAAWLAKGWQDANECGRGTTPRDWWPTVVSHDDVELQNLLREEDGASYLSEYWDAVVLSPGPGHPAKAADFANTAAGLALACAPDDLPVLGVCLGHQGLAWFYGARVAAMRRPRHGIVDSVSFSEDSTLLRGLPAGFGATRYHSLTVVDDFRLEKSPLVPTAWSDDGDILALQHRSLPRFGLQFHPESVATQYGGLIARNFAEFCQKREASGNLRRESRRSARETRKASSSYRVVARHAGSWETHDFGPDVAAAYYRSVASSDEKLASFWLDGSSEVSVVGDSGGPHGFVASHDASRSTTTYSDGRASTTGPFLDTLRRELDAKKPSSSPLSSFDLGFVGYLGYEMRSETFDYSPAEAKASQENDAAMIFCGRAVVFDHRTRTATSLELVEDGDEPSFFVDVSEAVLEQRRPKRPNVDDDTYFESLRFDPDMSFESYQLAARDALSAIARGDSYEACLTTRFGAEVVERDAPPFIDWYDRLRSRNKAPHASFFDFRPFLDVVVAGTSPERFMKVDAEGSVETRPIKGTAPRYVNSQEDVEAAQQLATSIKNQAENLMIADLLRNDLLRVCDWAHVDKLAKIESFATVHQLVTTVNGQLGEGKDVLDLLDASFPPGSMTGAPKRRTCDVINSVENSRPRGVYSGVSGFIGLDGTADLSVVIRTAVFTKSKKSNSIAGEELWRCDVGAGGALTALSNVNAEWDELNLKADAVINALGAQRRHASSSGTTGATARPERPPSSVLRSNSSINNNENKGGKVSDRQTPLSPSSSPSSSR